MLQLDSLWDSCLDLKTDDQREQRMGYLKVNVLELMLQLDLRLDLLMDAWLAQKMDYLRESLLEPMKAYLLDFVKAIL